MMDDRKQDPTTATFAEDAVIDMPPWRELRDRRATSIDVLERFGVRRPPVPIASLMTRMGIHLFPSDSKRFDGALAIDGPFANVWYRQDMPRTRLNFTLAHELGHLLLHDLKVAYRDISVGPVGRHSPLEQEANAFAGAILMPRFMLQPLIYHTGLSVDELAKRFDVSPAAMSVRIDWLRQGRSDL